jgi:hypothetical protein
VNSTQVTPLAPGSPLAKIKDVVSFNGSTDAALALQFAPPSCLHVLAPAFDSDLPVAPPSAANYAALAGAGLPLLGHKDAQALRISDPSLIRPAAGTPAALTLLFGAEPAHTWCYYYEKADLARANGDWSLVADLGDRAFKASFRPDDQSEYLPFIEAYARLKRWDDARQLTYSTADAMPILAPALCGVWQRVDLDPSLSSSEHDLVAKVEGRLGYCPVSGR